MVTISMMYLRSSIYALMFIIGITSAFLPEPFSGVGLIEFFIGFLIIIFIGHKSAFRQHIDGIFSQWTKPSVFFRMTLAGNERHWMILGAVMSISPILSIGFLILLQ